jgi:hypothetical protein
MDDLQQQYFNLGYILTEIEGIYYVQKQKTTGDSETITMPELWNQGRDNSCGTQ